MEAPAPATVEEGELAALLRRGWGIDAPVLTYLPKGGGSYHWRADGDRDRWFVTVDDLDTKPWIAPTRAAALAGLTAAYEVARALRDDGLDLVVAPHPTVDGSVLLPFDEQHAVSVFPFVDGNAGEWGRPIGSVERADLLAALAALHARPVELGRALAPRAHHLAERDALLAALDDLDGPSGGTALGRRARAGLAEHAGAVRARVDRFDALAAELDAHPRPLVLTHGEPHPGNLLHTADGLRLIDWDTFALAERERDLWMLDDGGDDLDAAAVELHRLRWTLSDLASLLAAYDRDGARARWAEDRWDVFVELLDGGWSRPYGPS